MGIGDNPEGNHFFGKGPWLLKILYMNMKENELHVETQNKRNITDISKFTIGLYISCSLSGP